MTAMQLISSSSKAPASSSSKDQASLFSKIKDLIASFHPSETSKRAPLTVGVETLDDEIRTTLMQWIKKGKEIMKIYEPLIDQELRRISADEPCIANTFEEFEKVWPDFYVSDHHPFTYIFARNETLAKYVADWQIFKDCIDLCENIHKNGNTSVFVARGFDKRVHSVATYFFPCQGYCQFKYIVSSPINIISKSAEHSALKDKDRISGSCAAIVGCGLALALEKAKKGILVYVNETLPQTRGSYLKMGFSRVTSEAFELTLEDAEKFLEKYLGKFEILPHLKREERKGD